MRFLLDTTFAIDFLRGEEAATSRFDAFFELGDTPCVNEVVLCELATGFADGNEPGLEPFLRAIEFVQPSAEMALLAGRWRSAARRRGYTISVPDALVGAAAASLDATVLTRNVRDFAAMPVAVEVY